MASKSIRPDDVKLALDSASTKNLHTLGVAAMAVPASELGKVVSTEGLERSASTSNFQQLGSGGNANNGASQSGQTGSTSSSGSGSGNGGSTAKK